MPEMIGTYATTAHNFRSGPSGEGRLVPPPAIVQAGRSDAASDRQPFWEASIPVSGEAETTLLASWHELIEILANHHRLDVPEVFEMPPAPTVRVRGRVRQVGMAPFVFVDELADRNE